MAKKKATKKKAAAPKKVAVKPAAPKVIKEALTKSGLTAHLAEASGVAPRDVRAVMAALEGAVLDCHWQEVPDTRRVELVSSAEAAIALLPPPRGRPTAGPVTTTIIDDSSMVDMASEMGSE